MVTVVTATCSLCCLLIFSNQCPSLVEQMVHGLTPGEGSNEAVNLLLKRPWSVMVGMAQMDKHVSPVTPVEHTLAHKFTCTSVCPCKYTQREKGLTIVIISVKKCFVSIVALMLS